MYDPESRLPVSGNVPPDQKHCPVLKPHGNHTHILVGSDGHDGALGLVRDDGSDSAGECWVAFLRTLVKVPHPKIMFTRKDGDRYSGLP